MSERGLVRLLALLLFGVPALPTYATSWQVGAASTIVNPPTGHMLAGYGRDRPATGVHDNLFAKAVMIRDGHTRIGLVTIDNIGLMRPDIEQLGALAADALPGFVAENLLVSSTHTHAGPDVVGLWGESLWSSGRDEAYIQALYQQVIKTLVQAERNAVTVTSKVGSVQAPMAWVENRSEPLLLDSTLSVLQFIDSNGASVATLTNYACHPTVLDGDNTRVSSDYVGGFYRAMAGALPGEHLFLQGAIGGWVQPLVKGDQSDGFGDDAAFNLARALGVELASAALGVIEAAESNPVQPIEIRSQVFDVELENWGFRLMMWLGVMERETFSGAMRTSASWLRIGGAQFVTHPGETSPAYSLASRALMNGPYTFVLGLTQDAMGYILKPEYFADNANFPHGEYLQSVSVGPQAGPTLMRVLGELVPAAP